MTERERCIKCLGTGRIYKDIFRGMGYEYEDCPDCNGTGKHEKKQHPCGMDVPVENICKLCCRDCEYKEKEAIA